MWSLPHERVELHFQSSLRRRPGFVRRGERIHWRKTMMTTATSPEKEKAIEYLTVRAEAMSATQIRARLRAAVVELEAALDGVDEGAARASVVPGEWTIAQVVDHVAQ